MVIKTKLDLLNNRRTKIVATLGPSSCDNHTIRHLIESGVNVFRLNMSHGNHEDHQQTYENVRNIAKELQQPVAIFADLCGPKIRTGNFENDAIELIRGESVTVTTRDCIGEPGLIPSQYEDLAQDVKAEDHILLDDGKLELEVDSVIDTEITCRVIHGGTLRNKKGINLPGVAVSAPSMTEKDFADARFCLKLGVDFLALSFVRTAKDIIQLRQLINDNGSNAGIISKFEKPEAMRHASEIIAASNAIMVARGDLGVELKPEQVPIAQRKLINMGRDMNCPVIVATQMLESMMVSSRPSRAEVSDISQAVTEGVDAVMLSGETAAGAYPIQTVQMMVRIVRQTEAYLFEEHNFTELALDLTEHEENIPFGHAIANAASELANKIDAKAILCLSSTGMSAVTISSARPSVPLLAVTADKATYLRLNLNWGTSPVLDDDAGNTNPNQLARRISRETGFAKEGEYIVLVRGFHEDAEFNTPSVTLINV